MSFKPRTVIVLLASIAGFVFAALSTFDFVQHLDRQVHDIHCSFIPGIIESNRADSGGCQATLMSPYSSVLRTHIWGGIPVALPAMGLFSFLFFQALQAAFSRTSDDSNRRALAMLTTSLIALATSAVMGSIAYFELQAACKLCIGIYASSILTFVGSLMHYRGHPWQIADTSEELSTQPGQAKQATSLTIVIGLAQLGLFSVLPPALYAASVPSYEQFFGQCGELKSSEDPYNVMVQLGETDATSPTTSQAIEVFDPLCPACRAFEHRFMASGLATRIQRKGLLFPLDSDCNWMISESLHPGACTVSEAVLCAAEDSTVTASDVLAWSFTHQQALMATARATPKNVKSMIAEAFPSIKSCIGSAKARSKLNKSMRWVVSNELPVLTPQFYLDGKKLCDEDTDLGLEYALTKMLETRSTASTPSTSISLSASEGGSQ